MWVLNRVFKTKAIWVVEKAGPALAAATFSSQSDELIQLCLQEFPARFETFIISLCAHDNENGQKVMKLN